MPTPYDALIGSPGPAGDLSREIASNPPAPGEDAASYQDRVGKERTRLNVIKARDLAARKTPTYLDPSGNIQAVTDEIAESLALANTHGALVADITAGGPAEKAGLQAGDIIIEFNGRPVNTMRDLPKIVAETPIGTQVPVKVLRKGKEEALTAEVATRLRDLDAAARAARDGLPVTAGSVPLPATAGPA